jgi:sugar/nucleoside kinase (ribokinase family)
MSSAATTPSFDLIGVGSPIMDLVATVPEEFLTKVTGAKGGMVLVDDDEMARILSLLGEDPAHATGGSAANVTFNASRLGLRSTFLGKLGNDPLAHRYRHQFEASIRRGSSRATAPTRVVSPSSPRTPSARCAPTWALP